MSAALEKADALFERLGQRGDCIVEAAMALELQCAMREAAPVDERVSKRLKAIWDEQLQDDLTAASVIVRKHDPSGALDNSCDRIGDLVDQLFAALAAGDDR